MYNLRYAVVCAGALITIMTAVIAFTSLELPRVPVWDIKLPPPPLIAVDTMRVHMDDASFIYDTHICNTSPIYAFEICGAYGLYVKL